jgi:hypothetical protein
MHAALARVRKYSVGVSDAFIGDAQSTTSRMRIQKNEKKLILISKQNTKIKKTKTIY